METLYIGLASFIALNILIGAMRIAFGPSRADRILAAQFLGTASVALFLIMAELQKLPSLRNLALVFVALASLTTIAFVKAYSLKSSEPS